MGKIQAVNAAIHLADVAVSVMANTHAKTAAKMYNHAGSVGTSLTALTSASTIVSRAFIDEAVVAEEVLPNIMRRVHAWYASQIIAALNLDQMVSDMKSVRDVLRPVQTGDSLSNSQDVIGRVGDGVDWLKSHRGAEALGGLGVELVGINGMLIGTEDHAPAMETLAAQYRADAALESGLPNASDKLQKENDRLRGQIDDLKSNPAQVNVRPAQVGDKSVGPIGEYFDVTVTNPKDHKSSVTVTIFVQIQPYLIPHSVAPRFVDLNVTNSVWQRWTMMRAGELSFLKDFIMMQDVLRKKKSFIKDPRSSDAFKEFMVQMGRKDAYAAGDMSLVGSGTRPSSNLANSIIVLTEDAVRQAKIDSAIDLHDDSTRSKYFAQTYTMILIVVDPMHQRVMTYFNGIRGGLNNSYNDFKSKDGKFDTKEIMQAIAAFSGGSTGRMR